MSIDDLITETKSTKDRRTVVKKIFKEYMSGNCNPLKAADAIQKVIGKISGYVYKGTPGSLNISNCSDRYPVPVNVSNNRCYEKVEDFKAALRIVARGNGLTNIEDHLEKGCSTKDYAEKFWKYALAREQDVRAKYAA